MKKILLVALALLVLTVSVAAAEGEVKIGQVQYAAHGTKCFAVLTVAMQGDVIADAYIDEYQFMATGSVGVPNSEADFGASFPEGKVLASKKVNAAAYSENCRQLCFCLRLPFCLCFPLSFRLSFHIFFFTLMFFS